MGTILFTTVSPKPSIIPSLGPENEWMSKWMNKWINKITNISLYKSIFKRWIHFYNGFKSNFWAFKVEGYTNSQRQGVAFIEVSWETVLAAFLQATHYPDPAVETPWYFPHRTYREISNIRKQLYNLCHLNINLRQTTN